jgi:hypothetical protein
MAQTKNWETRVKGAAVDPLVFLFKAPNALRRAGALTPENEWADAMLDYDAFLFRVEPFGG